MILAASVALFLIVELEKWVLRKRSAHGTPKSGQRDQASAATQ
ncbi:hypothetical protein [Halomonas sp. E19]